MDPEAPGPPGSIPTDEEQPEDRAETRRDAGVSKNKENDSLYRRGDKSGPRIECGHRRPLSTSLRQVGGCQESHHAEWGLAVCVGLNAET